MLDNKEDPFDNISEIKKDREADEAPEDDGLKDPMYDSTESMYFGESEEKYEKISRKRAKRMKGCIQMFYRLV